MVRLRKLRDTLAQLRVEATSRYPTAKFTDATILDKGININGTRQHIESLIMQAERRQLFWLITKGPAAPRGCRSLNIV